MTLGKPGAMAWTSAALLMVTLMASVHHAHADQKCWTNFGFCQFVNNECSGNYVSNLCNGPYTRRCCIPEFKDTRCEAKGGKCQSTSIKCFDGQYVVGLCGGPENRRCCVPKGATESPDARCLKQGGQCNDSSLYPCQEGRYISGLCAGASNRRCCVPYGASGACSAEEERLACHLLRSANVLPRRAIEFADESEVVSSPYNNLKDMCEGRMASRSSDQCDDKCDGTGGSTCLKEKLLDYLMELQYNGLIIIDDLAGSCRTCKHYEGLAVDLHRDNRAFDYISRCIGRGGHAVPKKTVVRCKFRNAD